MKSPKVISDLIEAHNNSNSAAFTECFSESASVTDEGQTYNGKVEIERWIKKAQEKYQTHVKPLSYEEKGDNFLLSAEVSGNFDGSPAILKYQFGLQDGYISSLSITG